ncbi:MAG: hypothetical protein KAJ73_09035 [Zetaproteobacteria bacterium]|nr:hypothetical protein [Zetaproteobacteria bacterium]
MDVLKEFIIELGPDQVYPSTEEGKVRVALTVRDVAGLLSFHHRDGGLGAVLSQVANTNITERVGGQVIEYLWDTNEHPTLIQGVLNICWSILVKAGYKLESAVVDRRLEAGKELTTTLAKMVDEEVLGGFLPCV